LLAGALADADPEPKARVHADEAEWIRAVRILRAELPAGDSPVVQAELVRAGAAEAGALAARRLAPRGRAVLPADAPAAAVTVPGARVADAVARTAPIVAAGVARRAVERRLALDAGVARAGWRVARRRICDEPGHRGTVDA